MNSIKPHGDDQLPQAGPTPGEAAALDPRQMEGIGGGANESTENWIHGAAKHAGIRC